MRKLLNFIKYNNAFTIGLAIALFSIGGAFANETVRDTVIGQTVVTRVGIDNTQIINANLDNFDPAFKIKSVAEDAKNYFVTYEYQVIYIKDNIWQPLIKERNLIVSKERLGGENLAAHVSKEANELINKELAYMREVQEIEKNKGLRKQTESVEYTGLKALVFDNKKREIVGYGVAPEENNQKAELVGIFNPAPKTEESKSAQEEKEKIVPQVTVVKEVVDQETIMKLVQEALIQSIANSSASSISSYSSVVSSSQDSSSSSSSESSISSSASSDTASSSSSSLASSSEPSSSSSSSSSESSSSSSTEEAASSSSVSESSSSSSSLSSSESSISSSASSDTASSSSSSLASSSEPSSSSSSSSSEASSSSLTGEASSSADSSSSAE